MPTTKPTLRRMLQLAALIPLLALPGLVNIHSHPTTEPGYRGVREDHGVPEQQMTGLICTK